MRALLEEYGFAAIAMVVAAAVFSWVIFGNVIPGMQVYVTKEIPVDAEEEALDLSAYRENFARNLPKIEINDSIEMYAGTSILLEQYIDNGTIVATNMDGDDISANIIIRAADNAAQRQYDNKTTMFGGSTLEEGVYDFILTVVDYTDEEYFGKISKDILTGHVNALPEEKTTTENLAAD